MKKETLTKEQQDNVVRRILLNYKIESIEFKSFIKDKKTGFYRLLFVINNEYKTGISVSDISGFNNSIDDLGLDPIEEFEKYRVKNNDFKNVKIKYLEE